MNRPPAAAHRSLGTTPANATPQHLHELLESFVREVCTQANPMRREMSACDPELSAFTRLYAAFNERLRSRQLATVVFSTFMSMIRALQMRNNMLLTRWRNNQCGPDCCIFLEARAMRAAAPCLRCFCSLVALLSPRAAKRAHAAPGGAQPRRVR